MNLIVAAHEKDTANLLNNNILEESSDDFVTLKLQQSLQFRCGQVVNAYSSRVGS